MSNIDDLIEKLEKENEKQNTELKEFFRKEMYENMNEFANKDVSFLDGNSIKDFYQEQVEFCDSKKNILKDFHEECLNDIDIVCKTLTKNKIC
ncbi:MAG: hypothetical protein K6E99_05235 [Bacilli bacterium]|nr:hypothetical protein [Bacilli bacterium]